MEGGKGGFITYSSTIIFILVMVLLSIFFEHLSLLIANLQVYYSDISLILYPRVGHRRPLISFFYDVIAIRCIPNLPNS